jgi:hypothetical protein
LPSPPAVALTHGVPLGSVMHNFDLATLAGDPMTRSH